MRIHLLFLLITLSLVISCGRTTNKPAVENQSKKAQAWDEASAVRIAKEDYDRGNASQEYDVKTIEFADAWRVELHVKQEATNTGGGMEYIIDKSTGKIRSKRIYQ